MPAGNAGVYRRAGNRQLTTARRRYTISPFVGLTEGAVMVSPNILPYEIANALTGMMRRGIIERERMASAFGYFRKIPVRTLGSDIEKALEIAWKYKTYAYDACYLELAKRLGLPILTFDAGMARVGEDLGIKMLGGKNAGV